jgi:hypothetical protein
MNTMNVVGFKNVKRIILAQIIYANSFTSSKNLHKLFQSNCIFFSF